MNKPTVMAMAALVTIATTFVIPYALQIAYAQGYNQAPGGSTLEEQLKLAQEKIGNAKASGAYGSGTPMLGTNISETIIFIAILAAIFGGVAAAFFIKGRGAKAETAS